MKYCKDCVGFDECKTTGRTVEFAVDDGVCIDFDERKPQTNADKIRSMTDDELNELFHEIYNAGAEDAVAYEWGQRTNSFEWTMEWLQMLAEEDDHA